MAAPAFGAIGTQLQGSASTMNVAAPSGVAVNDILVVSAFVDTAGATVTGMPSGWAQAPDSPITGPDNHKLYVMWKRADSGDTGASTFDFTLSSSVYRNAACERFTGATTSGSPWDVTNGVGSNNSQTTTEDVADTTTVADTLLVWSGTNWTGGTWTPPSGFTERRDSGDGVCSSADKVQNAAGSTGAIVGTCTGSDKRCAWMGALFAGTADSSSYAPPQLPGLIGPDGRVFAPSQRYDDFTAATPATNAPAGLADGTGNAPQPNVALGVNAGNAAAAGSAPQPSAAVGAKAGVAQADGAALQPTVTTSGSTNAPAGLAAATGAAFQPTIAIRSSAGLAAATGAALQPVVAVTVRPAAPVGAGSAPAATVLTGRLAFAGVAAATGSAFTALLRITANPPTAVAAGQALQPSTTAAVPLTLRVRQLYTTRVFGADGYHVGENHTVWLPSVARAEHLVVVCHGTASEASWYCDSPDRYRPLEALANTGMVVVAADLGEPSNADGWGNDLSVARVTEVINWAEAQFAVRTDKVSLLGDSAGGATALNWARAHNNRIAGIALRAGVCDIEAIYQGGAGNSILVALIDLAYTAGGGWPAQRATHDPALNVAELVPIKDRIRLYYTPNDGLVPPQATLDFAADVGCAAVPVGDMPHSDAVMTAIQPGDLANWLWSLI